MQQGLAVFDDIRDLLQQQFNRLSEIEQEIIYWLAINREPISLFELSEDVVTTASRRKIPNAMQSLLRRSLIEKEDEHFFLQPVVLEYITDHLVYRCLQRSCHPSARATQSTCADQSTGTGLRSERHKSD